MCFSENDGSLTCFTVFCTMSLSPSHGDGYPSSVYNFMYIYMYICMLVMSNALNGTVCGHIAFQL